MVSPRERGIVLVIVLWIITLLMVMAGSFAYSMRTETQLAAAVAERAQARALAEAGVAYAVVNVMLQKPDPDHPWPVEGSPREWTFGSGKVRISVVDAAGRIDLNHAAPELLKGLLTSAGGLEDAAAQALVDKIADFRDPDDAKQINGAEKADYQAAGRAPPKDSDFESVEELQQVLDMTPEIYERIAPALTMASGQPGIDPAAASALVLNAIPGSDPQMVEEYIAQRTEAIANQSPLPPPPAQLGAYLAAAQGLAYHVAVEAELETGTALAVRATVTQPRLPKQLYYTIDWRED